MYFRTPTMPKQMDSPSIWDDEESPQELLKAQNSYWKDQIAQIEKIASNSEIQATASKSISESAKTQADLAMQKAKKADIKGWIAVVVSVLAFIMELCDHLGFI